MTKRLLATAEAAPIVGLSKSTLNHWRLKGGGPPFLRIGRKVFYDVSDLQKWVDGQPRYQSTSEFAA